MSEEPQRELRRNLQRIYHGHGLMDSPDLMDQCSCAPTMRGLLQDLACGDMPGALRAQAMSNELDRLGEVPS